MAHVQSQVGELRSCKLCGTAKKKKEKFMQDNHILQSQVIIYMPLIYPLIFSIHAYGACAIFLKFF